MKCILVNFQIQNSFHIKCYEPKSILDMKINKITFQMYLCTISFIQARFQVKTLVMTRYNIEQRYQYTYIDRCKEVSTITTYLAMLLVLQRLGHPTYVHFQNVQKLFELQTAALCNENNWYFVQIFSNTTTFFLQHTSMSPLSHKGMLNCQINGVSWDDIKLKFFLIFFFSFSTIDVMK